MARPTEADPACTIKRTLCFLMSRSQRLLNQQLEVVFQQVGLNVPQYVALRLILEGHAKVPSEIAKTLGLDTGGATRLVDQLEERGLLVRKREAEDRRLVSLAVTPEGLERAKTAQAISDEYLDGLLETLPPSERQGFIGNLERLVHRLEAGSS